MENIIIMFLAFTPNIAEIFKCLINSYDVVDHMNIYGKFIEWLCKTKKINKKIEWQSKANWVQLHKMQKHGKPCKYNSTYLLS